jgi:hypothetical protein
MGFVHKAISGTINCFHTARPHTRTGIWHTLLMRNMKQCVVLGRTGRIVYVQAISYKAVGNLIFIAS